mmetsp:Transcript_18346/g.40628  ORF Transcript_18346/g.40628 Transcript_18346/m.40628 type:complete len:656 (-) Transcript_18346:1316-3283(-)
MRVPVRYSEVAVVGLDLETRLEILQKTSVPRQEQRTPVGQVPIRVLRCKRVVRLRVLGASPALQQVHGPAELSKLLIAPQVDLPTLAHLKAAILRLAVIGAAISGSVHLLGTSSGRRYVTSRAPEWRWHNCRGWEISDGRRGGSCRGGRRRRRGPSRGGSRGHRHTVHNTSSAGAAVLVGRRTIFVGCAPKDRTESTRAESRAVVGLKPTIPLRPVVRSEIQGAINACARRSGRGRGRCRCGHGRGRCGHGGHCGYRGHCGHRGGCGRRSSRGGRRASLAVRAVRALRAQPRLIAHAVIGPLARVAASGSRRCSSCGHGSGHWYDGGHSHSRRRSGRGRGRCSGLKHTLADLAPVRIRHAPEVLCADASRLRGAPRSRGRGGRCGGSCGGGGINHAPAVLAAVHVVGAFHHMPSRAHWHGNWWALESGRGRHRGRRSGCGRRGRRGLHLAGPAILTICAARTQPRLIAHPITTPHACVLHGSWGHRRRRRPTNGTTESTGHGAVVLHKRPAVTESSPALAKPVRVLAVGWRHCHRCGSGGLHNHHSSGNSSRGGSDSRSGGGGGCGRGCGGCGRCGGGRGRSGRGRSGRSRRVQLVLGMVAAQAASARAAVVVGRWPVSVPGVAEGPAQAPLLVSLAVPRLESTVPFPALVRRKI